MSSISPADACWVLPRWENLFWPSQAGLILFASQKFGLLSFSHFRLEFLIWMCVTKVVRLQLSQEPGSVCWWGCYFNSSGFVLLISQYIVFVTASVLMFPHSWVICQSIMWLYGLFFFILYESPSKLKLFGESGECFRCPWCIFRSALGRLLSCRKENGWVFSGTASL